MDTVISTPAGFQPPTYMPSAGERPNVAIEPLGISGCSDENSYFFCWMGRNPQTGEKIKIKGRNAVTFKPSKNLP